MADRLKEVEEIAETNRRASEEEQQQQQEQQNNAVKLLALHATTGSEKEVLTDETDAQNKDKAVEQAYEGDSSHQNHIGNFFPLQCHLMLFSSLFHFLPMM